MHHREINVECEPAINIALIKSMIYIAKKVTNPIIYHLKNGYFHVDLRFSFSYQILFIFGSANHKEFPSKD